MLVNCRLDFGHAFSFAANFGPAHLRPHYCIMAPPRLVDVGCARLYCNQRAKCAKHEVETRLLVCHTASSSKNGPALVDCAAGSAMCGHVDLPRAAHAVQKYHSGRVQPEVDSNRAVRRTCEDGL